MSYPKLTISYPNPDIPVPKIMTESGIDLTKEIPIREFSIQILPYEFPEITLSVLALPEVHGKLRTIILGDFDGDVEVINLREKPSEG